MRRLALVAAAGAIMAGSVVMAPPAQADHVIDFFPEGQCRWGQSVNPVGIDLFTPKFEVQRDGTGLVTSYTCYFRDIPAELGDWRLPRRATAVRPAPCWSPAVNDPRFGTAVGKITPAGTAAITCTF